MPPIWNVFSYPYVLHLDVLSCGPKAEIDLLHFNVGPGYCFCETNEGPLNCLVLTYCHWIYDRINTRVYVKKNKYKYVKNIFTTV